LDQTLHDDRFQSKAENLVDHYVVQCPDVLEVKGEGGQAPLLLPVGADGRVAFGEGRVRVEGQTLPEVVCTLERQAPSPAQHLHVQVAAYKSQQIFLFGEVEGLQRALPYQGPETVLAFLRRSKGLTSGAAVNDIHVIRAHVAEGKPPELFHVDLRAILLHHDDRSNVELRPFDEVYVGQTKQSSLECCFPPWVRPIYRRICGMGEET
jgi:protein involved in polysaccharide export with SLBB domain